MLIQTDFTSRELVVNATTLVPLVMRTGTPARALVKTRATYTESRGHPLCTSDTKPGQLVSHEDSDGELYLRLAATAYSRVYSVPVISFGGWSSARHSNIDGHYVRVWDPKDYLIIV